MTVISNIDGFSGWHRATTLDAQPRQDYLGPKGVMRYLQNKDGIRLAGYYWPAVGSPRAVVQLVHGQGTYLAYDFLRNTVRDTWHVAMSTDELNC